MVFYATAEGVVFEPLSAEAKRCAHDSKKARDRLSQIVACRREKEEKERRKALKAQRELQAATTQEANNSGKEDYNSEEDTTLGTSTELDIRRIEEQLKATEIRIDSLNKERDYNKYLADSAKFAKNGDSKAIPSNYVYQPSPADNAEKRAIVHHTGSHYHMAGSRQFQRGVRVKGVISRHSKQGAKMQVAREARRNMLSAREDARGERAAGGGKGPKGPRKSKKKKKNKNTDQ